MPKLYLKCFVVVSPIFCHYKLRKHTVSKIRFGSIDLTSRCDTAGHIETTVNKTGFKMMY